MGLTFVIRNFHDSIPLSRQNNWGAHLRNSPKGTIRHTKACFDADELDLRVQRDVLALRDLRIFRNETAPWNPHVGSAQNFVYLDPRAVTK